MKKKTTLRLAILVIPIALLVFLILFSSFYSYWNSTSPEKTCASCHEIGKSVNIFAQSSHRELSCKECHGTALSNGFHSLKEKGMMVVHHVRNKIIEDIRLNEDQLLAVMDNCNRCHTAEYAGWSSGGHSARYRHILLDKKHNQTEQINPDCLRCHGMFSDVPVQDLVEPLDKTGPWKMKNTETLDKPVIPCMACHQIHNVGFPRVNPDYSNPLNVFYLRQVSSVKVSFYYRPDKTNISAEYLPKLLLWEGDKSVNVSDDLLMRNCIQCHSPNARHQAGSSDDRTPRGVHEGIGCTACHEPHSNDARQSCIKCHPVISNCKLDVTKMNTTFNDPGSPNNIHWVACTDCHKQKGFTRK
jgi:hypothetical protein